MEAQYNVVGENVFLHRMETNTRFVTGAAFAVSLFFISIYNLVSTFSGAFLFVGWVFQVALSGFVAVAYLLYLREQEEGGLPEFGQAWGKLKTRLGAAAFHAVVGIIDVIMVIILESEDDVNKNFKNLAYLFGIGWIGSALFVLNGINYFIIHFSIQNDAPRTTSAPLPRPTNPLFTRIHRLLRPLTLSAQAVMITFAVLVFCFNIVNKVNRGYGFVCLLLLATLAELNTYSDDGQGERELFTIFGALNTYLARGLFYFLSAWAVFYFVIIMEELPYEIDIKSYYDEIISIIGLVDMTILFGLAALYHVMHLMIKEDMANNSSSGGNVAQLHSTDELDTRPSAHEIELPPGQKVQLQLDEDEESKN